MPLQSTILVIGNAALLVITLLAIAVMVHAGNTYNYHFGIDEVQQPLKWRIIRLLLLIIIMALVGAILNLGLPLITPLLPNLVQS